MQDHDIEKIAQYLNGKYGKSAIVKVVETAKEFVAVNDNASAERWVQVGYKLREIQKEAS